MVFELGQSVVGVIVAGEDAAVVDAEEPPGEVEVVVDGVEAPGSLEVVGPIEDPEVEEVELEGDALLLLDKKSGLIQVLVVARREHTHSQLVAWHLYASSRQLSPLRPLQRPLQLLKRL